MAYWISYFHSLCLSCTGSTYAPFVHVTLQSFPLRGELRSPVPLMKSLSLWPIWPIDCEKWQHGSSQGSLQEASWVSTCLFTLLSFSARGTCVCFCVCSVTQSCLTLWEYMDCSSPGSSVQGISQARILEWVAMSFPRKSSWPRDWTQVSYSTGWFFTTEPLGKHLILYVTNRLFREGEGSVEHTWIRSQN